MKIDKTLKSEIKKAASAHNYEENLKGTARILEHRYEWNSAFRQYGRAMVALCAAATILESSLANNVQREWAQDILSSVDGKSANKAKDYGTLSLYPVIVLDNLRSLVKATCDDWREFAKYW